jgi:RNA polymerase sigma-70 factor (ECF subfamily)
MDEHPTPEIWQCWLKEHAPRLLLFARQHARREADAQDLAQEAVVECWQRQGDGQPPPLPLVFATIRRRAMDLGRREDRRTRRELAASEPEPQPWFDTSVEDREMSGLIQEALGELPVEQREVLTLKIWAGLTFAEIAGALDIPANTAASRYRYALEALRRKTREVLA